MDSIYKLLQEIRKCPAIYLGKPSLERLYAFINGYKQHEEETSGVYFYCLSGFQEYIQEIYDIHTDHNWASIIQFFCSTDKEAFNEFYHHLDNFIAKQSN